MISPELRQWWKDRLTGILERGESEACLRVVERWCADHQQRPDEKLLENIAARLSSQEPLQYILGEAWFLDIPFRVTRDTLIPRPETEELTDAILRTLQSNKMNFADLCTGSGCIAVSLAVKRPGWKGIATDISVEALKVATENAERSGVSDRLEFRASDLLNELPDFRNMDLLVSNPPYVDRSEAAAMESNVLDWEPHTALFPHHSDVLIFYRRLASLLSLQPDGCELWAEINPVYAGETLDIYEPFSEAVLLTDLSGKQRFIRVVK